MKKIAVTSLLFFCLLLQGCATMMDEQRTKADAAAGGCYIILGKEKWGALGYLIVPSVYSEVAKRKSQYASREDFLAAEIQQVSQYNEEAKAHNQQLRLDIARLEEEVNRLQDDKLHEKERQTLLASNRAELKEMIQFNKALEQGLAKEIDILAEILAQERKPEGTDDLQIAKLETEVLELQKNFEELRTSSDQLAKIDERLQL
jgi:chromosome segregation ATPase